MGLDLVCGDKCARVGSYSTVQRLRAFFIMADADRVDTENPRTASRMRGVAGEGDRIDYKKFASMTCWSAGVRVFVNHSDCDGSWTPDEASDILDAVSTLRPYLLKRCPQFFYEEDDEFYLEELLRHSTETHENILFC